MAEALRRLQKLGKFSAGSQYFKLITTFSDDLDASVSVMLQQLRTYIFKDDFLTVVEEEPQLWTEIRKLLDGINQHKILNSLTQYLFNFEAFLDQVLRDLIFQKNVKHLLLNK